MSVPADNTAVLTYGASKEEVKGGHGQGAAHGAHHQGGQKVSTFPAFRAAYGAGGLVMEAAHEQQVARIVPRCIPEGIGAAAA